LVIKYPAAIIFSSRNGTKYCREIRKKYDKRNKKAAFCGKRLDFLLLRSDIITDALFWCNKN